MSSLGDTVEMLAGADNAPSQSLGGIAMGAPVEGVFKVAGKPFYEAPNGGFQIMPLTYGNGGEIFTAEFRPALKVSPGSSLQIRGTWSSYKGRLTLKVGTAEILPPSNIEGVALWAQKRVKGIGKVTIAKLALRFGNLLPQVMEDPDRLHREGGIKRKLAEQLSEAWTQDLVGNRARAFLRSLGLKRQQSEDVITVYGADCEALVQADPWCLSEIVGIGFETCDRIGQVYGLPLNHPLRIKRGIAAAFTEASQREGHTGLSFEDLLSRAARFLSVGETVIREAFDVAVADGHIQICPITGLWGTSEIQDFEYNLAREIARLRTAEGLCDEVAAVDAITAAEQGWDLVLDRESGQFTAAVSALTEGFSVITGGPGTGKSTVQGVITKAARTLRYMSDDNAILLGAPTGRAAKRLAEMTGMPAKTIHQLLEFSPIEGAFQRDRNNPLPARLIIIDEASMLDTQLAFHLLSAIKSGSSLILVGDVDQLPSVGPGQVLRDIIGSEAAPVTRLTRVRRTSAGSEIPLAATRINTGIHPLGADNEPLQGIHVIEPKSSESIPNLLSRIMGDRIKNLNVDPLRDVQVIAAMRKGPCGVEAMNDLLSKILNPKPSSSAKFGAVQFGVDDRVMNIRNAHALGLSNGDIGEVVRIDQVEGETWVVVDFGNGLVASFNQDNIDNLVHARATTVHKSQGCEFPVVIVVAPEEHSRMLDRNLLYTAVTRARQFCIIIGQRRVIEASVLRASAAKRQTGLRAYLGEVLKTHRPVLPVGMTMKQPPQEPEMVAA